MLSEGSIDAANGGAKSGKTSAIRLEPKITLFGGCTIIIGIIVGSGIFVSPKGVISEVDSIGVALCIWLVCGVYSLVGALCYAELGTAIPKSGGDYVYINEAFGELPAFLYLWVSVIIINPTSNAIMALTCARYAIQTFLNGCEAPTLAIQSLAASIICISTALNCYSVKWVTRIQNVFTVTKVAALGLIMITGFTWIFKDNSELLAPSEIFKNSKLDLGSLALGFYSGSFSFSGWNYLNYVTEELKHPYRNLPRAIIISIPIVTFIYVFTNISYFAVIPVSKLIESPAVAMTFAEHTMGKFAMFMPMFVAISCIGSINGCIFAASRIYFVGARDNLLPDVLAMINVNRLTPMPALISLGILSIFMLILPDVYVLINYLTFTEAAVATASICGLLKMKLQKRNSDLPIEIPLAVTVSFLIFSLLLLVIPFFYETYRFLVGLLIILSGIPAYYLGNRWNKPEAINNIMREITQFTQKILMCVKEDAERD